RAAVSMLRSASDSAHHAREETALARLQRLLLLIVVIVDAFVIVGIDASAGTAILVLFLVLIVVIVRRRCRKMRDIVGRCRREHLVQNFHDRQERSHPNPRALV